MVNVTTWDENHSLDQNKAKASSSWKVSEFSAKNIGYVVIGTNMRSKKSGWLMVSHDGERASFTLGEKVTDGFKPQLSTQLDALSDGDYRMYSAVKYLS